MPVRINDGSYLLPAPLVTFDKSYVQSTDGQTVGASYNITLAGQILPNKGNPIVDSVTFESSFSTDGWTSSISPDDDPNHGVEVNDNLLSIMGKQEQIRNLFKIGQAVKVEILDLNLRAGGKGIKFIGNVISVNFPNDGRWLNPCPYTISLETANFLNSVKSGVFSDNYSEDGFKYFVNSASETWGIQESTDRLFTGSNADNTIKIYDITHNVSAVGQAAYTDTGVYTADSQEQTLSGKYTAPYVNGLAPWQQASGYVQQVLELGSGNFPGGVFSINGDTFDFGNTFFDNAGSNVYILADRKISEDIDIRGGGYSISESFRAVPSGDFNGGIPVIHTNVINVNRGDDGLTSVGVEGTIRGLNSVALTGSTRHESNSYANAVSFYKDYLLGQVGGTALSSRIYHLAKTASELNWLHPYSKNYAQGLNPTEGTLTYSYNYDDRPPNIIQGSISEDIQISDTYPGQIFATIPVIGRNQPVLQYVNSRSEYKRSLTINVQMQKIQNNWVEDSGAIITASGYWNSALGFDTTVGASANDGINWWLNTRKPSITNSGDFSKIFEAANPANETAANGWANYVIPERVFYSAPQESWNPRTGQYSYSVDWTYERIS
jgi:hypothetical protein